MGRGGSWNPVEIIENAVSSTGDLLASVDPGPAIGGALAEVDDFVNDEIPGGWALPAAIAVAYMTGYIDPSLLGGEAAFTGATETGLATLAGEGAVADTIGTTLLSGTLEGATAAGQAAYAEALATGLSEAEALAAADAASTTYFQGGSNFVGLSPEYAAELGLEGSSGLGIEGMAGDPLAGLSGVEETFTPEYPGDSQYEIQDLQEQARATDVKPGSPTSWDAGDPLIPQDVKDALNAANKARQVYNLLSGVGGGMVAKNMPTLGQYTTPTTAAGTQNIGIPNLTAGIVRGQPIDLNIDQFNAPLAPINVAEGGYIQNYAEAGEVDSYTDTNYQDTVSGLAKLKPNLIRGKSDFSLQKYWNPAAGHADGGSIEGHNPEFFSEGGLQNRYVKGEGDGTSDDVPAMLANGEFVIPADVVSSLGNGSNDSGAHLLDEFLQVIREHKRNADSRELPPDSKGPLGYLLEAKRKAR